MTIPIQVNGRLRDTIDVDEDAAEEQIVALALARPKIQSHTGGNTPKRIIYVPGRMLNIIV